MNVARLSTWPWRLTGATAFVLLLLADLCSPQAVTAQDAAIPGAVEEAANSQEDRFLAENETAMATMMAAMARNPTGDVDRDFVALMVPHHQGAIDMAVALLRYGRNERLQRLAQEIIVTQQQEIAAMRLAIGEPLPPLMPAPTIPSARPLADATVMLHHATSMRQEPSR